MKFDTIIIGGGLSGLTCGIQLAEQKKSCAIVSSGQSAIHFFSGSLDLLGNVNGSEVVNPLEGFDALPEGHPYKRIGRDNFGSLADQAPQLLSRAGLTFNGESCKNHYVLTPMGTMKPTWLTLDDFTTFEDKENLPWSKALIVNFTGFLDFHTLFIKDGLKQLGIESEIKEIAMEQFEAIRRNPSEMRSSNIAKVFENGNAVEQVAAKINQMSSDAEVIILPAVFGLFEPTIPVKLKDKVSKPVVLLPALPPSTPGIRAQIALRQRFQQLGGTYMLGDSVVEGVFEGNRLLHVHTKNHGDIKMEADNYVLASGSFYSKGIVAGPDSLYDPIFGLDIDGAEDRSQWFDKKVFNEQPFMRFGVKTDAQFHAVMGGEPVQNLYVAGSVLSGANPLKEGSGAGICMLTSLHIADQILG